MSTTNENFFQKIEDDAVKIVHDLFGSGGEVATIESSIAKFGNAVVNEYKKLSSDPKVIATADFFVGIAESIDPGLTKLISGIELAFPKIVNVATGVLGEVNKPVPEQLTDGVAAIANIKAANSTIGSNVLGGIASAVSAFVFSNNATELNPATDSQIITAQQVVHQQAA
jgi:hypothetical protein